MQTMLRTSFRRSLTFSSNYEKSFSCYRVNNVLNVNSSLSRALLLKHENNYHSTSVVSASIQDLKLKPFQLQSLMRDSSFNVTAMTALLDHDNHEMRQKFREFISDKIMTPRYNIPLDEERDIALKRLQRICDAGFISVLDFVNNPLKIFAAHELAAIIDPAMTVKMTVQFNLFGGTILKLGTERHHEKLLAGIDTLEDVGCFGLTELGYGNNAVEMETTAIYDKDSQEFIINTPTTLAQKYWITNGAIHAKHVVVFAQLQVDGENHGIHGILVRIRDNDLKVMPNVRVEDMGHKMGLNGVDNAKLVFDNIRVPRENLLNKFSDVTEDGKFVSKIKGFGTFMGLAHAAVTAEGDNSVLMQKVAKERLSSFKPLKVEDDLAVVVSSNQYLHNLLNKRENLMFRELGKKLEAAGKAGLFNTWMLQESDTVQAAAKSYGERLISDQCQEVYNSCDDSLKGVLRDLHKLYILDIIEKDALKFITSGLIDSDTLKKVESESKKMCRELSSQSLSLVDSFGITDDMISAPIAKDWVDYNVGDNQGEH